MMLEVYDLDYFLLVLLGDSIAGKKRKKKGCHIVAPLNHLDHLLIHENFLAMIVCEDLVTITSKVCQLT